MLYCTRHKCEGEEGGQSNASLHRFGKITNERAKKYKNLNCFIK
jgi:hypothetical protein